VSEQFLKSIPSGPLTQEQENEHEETMASLLKEIPDYEVQFTERALVRGFLLDRLLPRLIPQRLRDWPN